MYPLGPNGKDARLAMQVLTAEETQDAVAFARERLGFPLDNPKKGRRAVRATGILLEDVDEGWRAVGADHGDGAGMSVDCEGIAGVRSACVSERAGTAARYGRIGLLGRKSERGPNARR